MSNDFFSTGDYTALVRKTLARASLVNAVFTAIIVGFDRLPAMLKLRQSRVTYLTDTGSANTYAVTQSEDTEVGYTAGESIIFKAVNANTGASTINKNARGAVAIKRQNGDDLSSGDIPAGGIIEVRHNGTNFTLMTMPEGLATAAAASATAAATSETNAATSATNAATSATNAATSATAAQTAETNAETAETNAETAETNAETAETNAAASATTAENAARSVAFRWAFDSSTAMADPGTGDLRLNNATIADATAIAIDDLSADTGNPDVSVYVLAWDDSTTTSLRGTLIIRKVSAPENFAVFNITGASTDNVGWTELAVTYVTGSGTFSNTDALTVQFVRTGDQGAGDLVAANNLSDVANAATAFTNIKQAATASATGVVELATDAETITGTDTARAVTPANVAAAAVAKTGGTMTGDLTMSGASIFDANASIAAHATTMDPWSLGNYVTLTGVAVTFSAMANAPQAGAEVELYMNAAHIFTDGAVFEVDGDANFTAEAGDRVLLRAKSTTVFTVHPRKKTGQAVGAPAAASDTAAGIVELATVAETKAGTDTARVVTPDSLAEGGQLDGVPGTDHTANGPQTNSFVANGSSTVMDLVYLNSTSKWASADASAATTAGGVMLAISLATKSADEAMNVALPGSFVRDDTWNWTPGDELYVSETAAAITATAPTTTDAVVRVVGWAVTADVIYFNPSSSWITVT